MQTMLLPALVELACGRGERGRLCARTEALFELSRKYGSEASFVPAGLLLLCRGNASTPQASSMSTCDRRFIGPATIHIAAGHMHLLGASIRLELNPEPARTDPARHPAVGLPLAERIHAEIAVRRRPVTSSA